MDIKGFKTSDGTVHKYDYNALANTPDSDGNVAYDEEQELTEEQKAQARANIGAQPVGEYLTEVPEGYAKNEDIKKVDRKVDTLREVVSKFHSNIVEEAKGNIITLDDASDMALAGLRIFGKTLQNGTPTPESPVPLVSAGDGGAISITISGENAQTQTLPVSTPNGLPGICVASGGNYTDAQRRQWICDEVDFGRGVYVQRVNKLRVTESNGVDSVSETYVRCQANVPRGNNVHFSEAKNTLFPLSGDYTGAFAHAYVWNNYIYWFLPKETVQNVVEANAWLSDNDFRFAYVLENPNETPIPEDELAAYAALHTNYPNTTIFNDGGAGMEVKYAADTKLYIDKKFAELSAALLNQ